MRLKDVNRCCESVLHKYPCSKATTTEERSNYLPGIKGFVIFNNNSDL